MIAEMSNKHLSQSIEPPVSHNLFGQKLGRKGLETRERILTATLRLLEPSQAAPITLTSVGREASVGMTNLYRYFPDIGDLILAALNRVMDTANAEYADRLRNHWPDDKLAECSLDFMNAHYSFWQRHARILHMRNSFADANDARFVEYRNRTTYPLRDLLVLQMEGRVDGPRNACVNLATVLLIGFERVATVVTNPNFHITAKDYVHGEESDYIQQLITAEAGLIELAIRQQREIARKSSKLSDTFTHSRVRQQLRAVRAT